MNTTQKKRIKKESHKTDLNSDSQKSASLSPSSVKKDDNEKKRRAVQYTDKKGSEIKGKRDKKRFAAIDITVQFLRDAKIELKKVKWPSRKELIASTVMVLVLVIAVSIYLGIIDVFLSMLINKVVG